MVCTANGNRMTRGSMRRRLVAALVLAVIGPAAVAARPPAKAKDFQCILNGVKAERKNFYIFHRSKRKLARAVRMTRTGKIPKAGYPVGTILQLFPFEAMIKRPRRFNRDGHGWEFVRLNLTSDGVTEVLESGKGEVANRFGSCQGCHARLAPDHDLVCEFTVGTSGLGLTDAQVAAIQAADPRCR
jgi:hypothetical protein